MVKVHPPIGPVICRRTHHSHPFGIFYGENPLDFSFPLMLMEISLVILITRILRFLLKPLKQPRIVSEVLGGFIVGPSVLGRNKKFAAYMYPDNASYVLKNVGLMGLMYFLFMSGVKMDLGSVRKSGKKQWYLALLGVFVPFTTATCIGIALRKISDKDLARPSSIGGIASALATTVVPVIYPIVREMNLLSSEIGRLALSTALISDVVGMNFMVAFEAAKQGEAKLIDALWYYLSLIVLGAFILGVIRQAMFWIIRTTPEGKPVDQIYVIFILLGVMIVGFLSDMFGLAIANGPLWLGMAIPDGPPLGSTLVEKSETFIVELLMPFSFTFVGMTMDVNAMSARWSSLMPLLAMSLAAYITKIVASLVVARFFDMPLRDGLTFSLIMSLRGQVEILLFMHWMDLRMIKQPAFTMMVLLTVMVTAISTPLIRILYDPTRPFLVNTRRTIQHTPPNTEFHIVAGIHDQESVSGFINLLGVSHPTRSSPFSVYALRLVELVGRTNSLFIDHENQDQAFDYSSCNPIHNALSLFEETRGEFVKIHSFTSVSPKRTMYQDICELALLKKATLIILTFHKEFLGRSRGGTEVVMSRKVQSVNSTVLSHAPCSVAILVDKGPLVRNNLVNNAMPPSLHHFAVLFLGGADAREALAYADRMAGNPDVALTVIRFLSHDGVGDDDLEKKLDDGLVTWFWVKNEANARVIYREVVVKNGSETVAAIRAMNNTCYDLWIVGRKHGINPVLVQGLSDWSNNNELGVVGDFVASMDFKSAASVLVVQQQVLREELAS
ncbi:cation/H(+) antiporter 24-like [Cornus florida]|uniref:cation/H(+) antiporter 24-like n=1 Tax=Cornus florida TaxID=4283 RepID=UPI00289CD3DA|nr:cation/H(+) antiporter 24-like [Cornus florida]